MGAAPIRAVRMSDKMWRRLARAGAQTGYKRSELIRYAVANYLLDSGLGIGVGRLPTTATHDIDGNPLKGEQ